MQRQATMPMISVDVDDEVYEALRQRARPFDDTPNTVLRQLLNLDDRSPTGSTSGPPLKAALSRNKRQSQGPGAGAPPRSHPASSAAIERMRGEAIAAVEAALSSRRKCNVHLERHGSGQRYLTPSRQVIYLHTRSYEPRPQPFFGVAPSALQDADWHIFVCEGRAQIVIPGGELRKLAPSISKDRKGNLKPTFIVDSCRCDIYSNGHPLSIPQWRSAHQLIADSEQQS